MANLHLECWIYAGPYRAEDLPEIFAAAGNLPRTDLPRVLMMAVKYIDGETLWVSLAARVSQS